MDRLDTLGSDQLTALAEKHRLAVLRRLMAAPATISQLGRAFDQHAAWARHHIKKLEAVGLVELAEIRQSLNYVEKIYRASAGAYQSHLLITPDAEDGGLIALGSSDFALDLLAHAEEGPHLVPVAVGSLDGLVALRQGLADIAGSHLLDPVTSEYNTTYVRHIFPDQPIVMVTLAEREQGLILPEGNPKGLSTVEDLLRPDVMFINRNPGSGTRVWLETQLRALGAEPTDIPGYDKLAITHAEAARAVVRGEADAAIGVREAAERAGLDFVPLFSERYDLAIHRERVDEAAMQALLERLGSSGFRREVSRLAGYDATCTGHDVTVAA